MGLTVTNPRQEFVLLRVELSALGFRHYFLSNVFSTRNGNAWRFHGELPVPTAVDTTGEMLAITADFEVE